MKSDLDRLMQARGLDALLISGPSFHNPVMRYITGDAHLSSADVIIKRGAEPVLFYRTIERDEAALTGLTRQNIDQYHLQQLFKRCGGNLAKAHALRYQMMFADLGITAGRVALYGLGEVGEAFAVFSELQAQLPELKLVGELNESLLLQVMATKDEQEIERIRRMGQITIEIVDLTADFLTRQAVKDQVLVKADGNPLTIGDVKQQIDLWVAERGAENPEGIILAPGREAAVPHSSGDRRTPLRLGQTLVFDIFPCEAGGGYFHDFTRTWCLGYAPEAVQAVYADVLAVYQQLRSELQAGAICKGYQERACELFEARQHPTIRMDPQTQHGYVHGLGHGVGLHIHERPSFGMEASEADCLTPGTVFTLEPGLYYPEQEMGVRLEDTLWVRPDGLIVPLVEYPLDLVLPMKGN